MSNIVITHLHAQRDLAGTDTPHTMRRKLASVFACGDCVMELGGGSA